LGYPWVKKKTKNGISGLNNKNSEDLPENTKSKNVKMNTSKLRNIGRVTLNKIMSEG